MSPLINANSKKDLEEEFEAIDEYMEDEDSREKRGALAGWGISLGIHSIVILVLMFVVVAVKVIQEPPSVRNVTIDPPQEMPEPDIELTEIDPDVKPVIHDEVVTAEETIITELDIVLPEEITTEEMEEAKEAKGRENAVSDCEMGGQGAFAGLGAGGSSKGAFGRQIGGDKRRIGNAYGPNAKAARDALEAALRWLKRHQSPNGQWDSDTYFINCTQQPKCEPGKNVNGADEALTGYAVLCFLGAGYDHKIPSQFRNAVSKGIDWLIQTQQEDGLIGRRNYEHAICAMALAEAYAMTMDPKLKSPTEKAIQIILDRQVKDVGGDEAYAGLGWDYINPKPTRIDSSVSGWNVMSIKSAKVAGIDVQNGMHGSKEWVERAWKAANPNWENLDNYGESTFPYTWDSVSNSAKKDHLSFIGSLCAVFLGYQNGDILLDTMINDMNKRWFDTEKYKTNSYALYYSTLSAFLYGGTAWTEKWGHPENGYVPWLIETQYKQEGCQDGTWPVVKENWHGGDTSPVLTHVYKVFALEVAYRYLPIGHK